VDTTILSFHGTTSEANIESACSRCANTGNRGHYGGIYFSEHANVAEGYARGRISKVLLCTLLLGREYNIVGGAPPVPGFDRHVVHGLTGSARRS
jgi:hypothetical protein